MAARQHSAVQGLAWALAGFAVLSLGDATAKSMAGMWPGIGIALVRYLLGMIGLGIAVGLVYGHKGFVVPRPWLQFLRGAAIAGATVGFFMGVHLMALADATAITFTSPVLTALLSALFLGEKANRSVWIATALAFVGVLVVLRPEVARLGWAVCFPLLGALGMATTMVANRKAAGLAPVLVMQFLVALFASPVLIGIALVTQWSGIRAFHLDWPSLTVLLRCGIIALTGTFAHLMIYVATERASAAVIAPMTYVQLLVALLFGWFLFHESPDWPTFVGAGLIVGSGLYLWHSHKPQGVPEGTE